MSRILLIGPDTVLERQSQLLLGDAITVLPVGERDALLTMLLRQPEWPQAVVFGPMVPPEVVYGVAAVARRLVMTLAIVDDGPELPSAAIEAGINDRIPTGAQLEDVDELFVRAAQRVSRAAGALGAPRVARPPGRVIIVTAPKGGVGKTTTAVNLATALAAADEGRTVLVDLDLQFGDVASALDLAPIRSVAEAVTPAAARDLLLVSSALTTHPRGLQVLAAPESPAIADSITPEQVSHLLRQLASEFAYTVVDTAPGLTPHTLAALDVASDVVAVTSPDVASVRSLAKTLAIFDELEIVPDGRHLVLNLVDRRGLRQAEVEEVLDERVEVVIPRSRLVEAATNRGVPVIVGSPSDRASVAFRDLVSRIEPSATRRRVAAGR